VDTLAELEQKHAAAEAAGNTKRSHHLRAKARERAAGTGEPVPAWASQRPIGGHNRKGPAPAAELGPPRVLFEVPEWARRWRANAPGNAPCVRVNERGVELSYFDDSGQRLECFVPAAKFRTESCASYALASGVLRFAPVRASQIDGSFKPRLPGALTAQPRSSGAAMRGRERPA
jgi:hypothetical protein